MNEIKYVALLRGINVGGGNLIKMTDLKTSFESFGLQHVSTFIQSGNVLFEYDEKDTNNLEEKIEKGLSLRFPPYQAWVLLLTQTKLKQIVDGAPQLFINHSNEYRCDVIFLKKPLEPSQVMKSVEPRAGVDELFSGPEVVYFARLDARATQSRLPRIISMPIYQNMTIRNWNTTRKLLSLME